MTTTRAEYGIDDLVALLRRPAFREALAEAETAGTIQDEVYRECADQGLFALGVPQEHGGLDLSLLARTRLHAMVAQASASLHSVLVVHEMAAYAIAQFGRPEVAGRWLRRMATGRDLGAFALTEPAGGSDFEQVTTTVVSSAGGMRLDGTKSWASSGQRAGVVVVFAISDAGPLAVLVPTDTPGLTVRPAPDMSAFRAASMATLGF